MRRRLLFTIAIVIYMNIKDIGESAARNGNPTAVIGDVGALFLADLPPSCYLSHNLISDYCARIGEYQYGQGSHGYRCR